MEKIGIILTAPNCLKQRYEFELECSSGLPSVIKKAKIKYRIDNNFKIDLDDITYCIEFIGEE